MRAEDQTAEPSIHGPQQLPYDRNTLSRIVVWGVREFVEERQELPGVLLQLRAYLPL